MAHEYKEVFVEEAREQVDILNERLLEIEKDSKNTQYIHDIFRVAHTLKSSAAFVGLQELSDFCHKIENLLQKIRDKEIDLSPELMDFLFKSLDKIRDSVEAFADNDEVLKDFQALSDRVSDFHEDGKFHTGVETVKQENTFSQEKSIELDDPEWNLIRGAEGKGDHFYYVAVYFENDVKMKWVRAELVYVNIEKLGTVIKSFPLPDDFKTEKLDDRLEALISADKTDIEEIKKNLNLDLIKEVQAIEYTAAEVKKEFGFAEKEKIEDKKEEKIVENKEEQPETSIKTEESIEKTEEKVEDVKVVETKEDKVSTELTPPVAKEVEDKAPEVQEQADDVDSKNILSKSDTVRVPIKKLDELLNLVGELAITNSGFVEISDRFHELLGNQEIVTEFETKIDQLSNIARNLQEGIMQSRMVPIGSVFSRFTRLVRDLSRNLDKKVNIIFKGEETELDKKIIDVIGDPLIHLIRNSIDHGLESTADRIAKGKSEVGSITLNAYQSGNYIFVEVQDDGHGLNKDKILQKALEKEIISEEEAKNLIDNEIYNLIFLPGFSTKSQVTAISGRGVGMDVVISTVNNLNGSVSVKSEENKGSTFTLSFPLTLAIVPAILTQCGIETYAIPLSNVLETIKVSMEEVKTVDFQEVIRLRDQVIPLLRLNETFDVQSEYKDEKISVVISEVEEQQVGIVVDRLLGKREIVIKALSQDFQEMQGISGATILGNGQIALILDIHGLIRQSRNEGSLRRKRQIDRQQGVSITARERIMDIRMGEEKENLESILKEFNLDHETYKLMKEIFKVALATSANNVKNFLNKNVVMAVPDIEAHSFERVKKLGKFVGNEKMFFAELDITDSLHGKIIVALDHISMKELFSDLLGGMSIESEVGQSCIMEIGNLLAAGITNTLSRALKIKVYPGPPKFSYEEYNQYFTSLFEQYYSSDKYLWIIDTDIIIDDKIIKGKVYVLPYDRTFKLLGKTVKEKKDEFSYMLNNN